MPRCSWCASGVLCRVDLLAQFAQGVLVPLLRRCRSLVQYVRVLPHVGQVMVVCLPRCACQQRPQKFVRSFSGAKYDPLRYWRKHVSRFCWCTARTISAFRRAQARRRLRVR